MNSNEQTIHLLQKDLPPILESKSYFNKMTHFDLKTLLPALLHVEDRMSMAHGLESRVPFLAREIIEFAATMPADVKFKDLGLLVVDEETGDAIYGPDIIPRGVVFEHQIGLSLKDAKPVVLEVLQEYNPVTPVQWTEVEAGIKRKLKRFFYNAIEKNPLILPIIIPV